MPTSITDHDSSWSLVMNMLKEICEKQNNGRYHVRRGAVNWSSFDFESHSWVISVLCDDRTFMNAVNTATLTLEIFQKMPKATESLSDEGVSVLSRDAFEIFVTLLGKKRVKSNDALITRFHTGSDSIIESSDSAMGIEGIVATIKIDYAE